MSTMPAAYVEALGAPDRIVVGELPVPAPGPTDVLVRVELVAVDPVDTFVRSGRYPTPTPFPFVVGRDLVGTVASAPPGTGFAPGERVWCSSLGHDGRQGSFSGYAVVPAARCYRAPDGVAAEALVALVASAHPASTAYLAWFVHARLRAGATVYVGGAAGNVGGAATVLARRAGARVLASAHPDDHDRCRALGADAVLDYRAPDLAEQISAAAPGGVDVFWDTSGHHDFELVLATTAPKGRVLLTAGTTPGVDLPVARAYTRDLQLLGFVISRAAVDDLAAAAGLVGELVAAGELRPRVGEVRPLSATAEVHARMEAGEVIGRVVLSPWR